MSRARWTLIALLCCWAAALHGCASAKQAARKLKPGAAREFETRLTMAQIHEREGKLQKAANIYAELLKERPEHAKLCHRYGVVLTELGKGDEGVQYLERARTADPNNAAVLSDLGYAYLISDELESAETLLRDAFEQDPRDERTVNNLALAVGLNGRFEESQALYERVNSRAEAQANLGYICVQRGDGQRAMAHFNKALDLDPSLKPAAEALVQLHEMKRSFDAERPAIAQWAERQKGGETGSPAVEDRAAKVSIRLTGAEMSPERPTE